MHDLDLTLLFRWQSSHWSPCCPRCWSCRCTLPAVTRSSQSSPCCPCRTSSTGPRYAFIFEIYLYEHLLSTSSWGTSSAQWQLQHCSLCSSCMQLWMSDQLHTAHFEYPPKWYQCCLAVTWLVPLEMYAAVLWKWFILLTTVISKFHVQGLSFSLTYQCQSRILPQK